MTHNGTVVRSAVAAVAAVTTPAYAKDVDLCWSLGGAPVCGRSFVTGTQPADDLVVAEDLGGTAFNTGFAFFAEHVVAWDHPGSRLLVAPKPAAAPSSTTLGG